MHACEGGYLNIVKYLIQNGADINSVNALGWDAICVSSSCNNKTNIIIKYLLLNGSKIHKNTHDMDFLDYGILRWCSYEIQKLICERLTNGFFTLKQHKDIPLHKWIKDEYPESEIYNELGFFERIKIKKFSQYFLL